MKRKADAVFDKPDRPNKAPNRLSEKSKILLQTRQKLPIWPHADEIRTKVKENDVLLLVGETGSGKSTQVPQFLFNEKWCRKTSVTLKDGSKASVGGCIGITQPRRVAATSLARRVAEEVGTPLGNSSPASQVGYSVRFDNSTSPSTKIKFLTDGMLLQELLRDPWLKEYSCLIVDEVHERGVNVDLSLGFLKRLVENKDKDNGRGGIPLRMVVMSATADMEKVETFFKSNQTSPVINGESVQANGNARNHENGNDEWSGFSDGEDNADHLKSTTEAVQALSNVESCFIKGRQYPVQTTYTTMPTENILDSTMERIIHLHTHTPLPGDVLVFLSGQEMIENLESLCQTYASSLNQHPANNEKPLSKQKAGKHTEKLPHLLVLPLFAALPTHAQQRVFHSTPPFTRKIILATDIAETSVTVSGVRHVIDTGKHKSRHFRPALNLDTLLTSPISRSSAAQRAGRAGREAPGTCYRLYTQEAFYKLEADTPPEILQTDLSFLVLTLKSHGVSEVLEFPLLTPPPKKSLESALLHLLHLDAIDGETGAITDIGRKMSMLPLRPDLGRIVLASTLPQYNCVDEVVDIVAGLSLEEGIWLPIHNRRPNTSNPTSQQKPQPGSANPQNTHHLLLNTSAQSHTQDSDSDSDEHSNPILAARRTLFRRSGDHMTLLAAIQAYSDPSVHDRRLWCDQHGVSHRAMSRILDVRKQLRQLVTRLTKPDQLPATQHLDLEQRVLKCLLTGLWPNIATLGATSGGTAPYTTLLTRQPLHLHPSSFLFTHRTGPSIAAGSGRKKQSGQSKGDITPPVSRGPPTIMFTDFIYTAKPYARNVSAVEMAWLDELQGS